MSFKKTIEFPNSQEETTTHHSGLYIMLRLLRFVLPLMPIMLITIIMGVLGFLAAIGITVFGVISITSILHPGMYPILGEFILVARLLLVLALSRGALRYLEQYSGHYIAFRLLAFMRDRIYKALRRLAPAKTEGKSSGKLIAMVTSDVELLEVFFAHTIAPIAIGIITSLILVAFIASFSLLMGGVALVAYITIGFIIPYFTSRKSREDGRKYREDVSEINTAFLESLYGMREIMLFGQASTRMTMMEKKSLKAQQSMAKLKEHQGRTKAMSESAILIFSLLILITGAYLNLQREINFVHFLIPLVTLMSSFGPVIALSNLANSLLQTLASGERILELLDEKPQIAEVRNGSDMSAYDIDIKNISFGYGEKVVLQDVSLQASPGQIIGIMGKSGSGKSTLLKLLMRFYDASHGQINMGGTPIAQLNTSSLRQNIGYVTQETFLFNSSIEENLRIAKRDARYQEMKQACLDANIHDFIMSLPQGYSSNVGQLGDLLSGGEQQRLGLARAFLHESKIILMDEPTSNLDSLNEGIILDALKKHAIDQTIILVSHRLSTLSICDKVYQMENGKLS